MICKGGQAHVMTCMTVRGQLLGSLLPSPLLSRVLVTIAVLYIPKQMAINSGLSCLNRSPGWSVGIGNVSH